MVIAYLKHQTPQNFKLGYITNIMFPQIQLTQVDNFNNFYLKAQYDRIDTNPMQYLNKKLHTEGHYIPKIMSIEKMSAPVVTICINLRYHIIAYSRS